MKKYVAAALILALSLCGFAAADGESTKISFICSAGGSGRSFEGGLNNFIAAQNGEIDVSIDMVALSSLPDQLMTQFISGTAFYDVIAVNSVWQASMANFLLPLNGYIENAGLDAAALYGETMAACTYDGDVIGLPIRTGTDVLYYRQDLLKEKGVKPPTDLQELLAAARALTEGPEDNRELYGFAFMAQDPFFCTNMTADFLYPHGIYFLNEAMTAPNEALLSEAAADIFRVIYALWDEKLMPNPMSWTYDDSIVALQEGRIAMTMDDFMRAPTVEKEGAGAAGKMGYASFQPRPTGPEPPRARGGWWILSIDKNSPHPDESFAFIEYMCGYETQKYMANEWSNGPSILSLMEDETFNRINRAAAAGRSNFSDLGMRDPVSIGCREELATAIQNNMHDLFLGRKAPAEVGPAMYEDFKRILEDY